MSLAGSRRPSGWVWSSRRPRSTRLLVVAYTTANVRRGVTRLTMVPRACTVTGPGESSAAAFHLGLEPGPAREAVVAGDGELGGRQSDHAGGLAKPAGCAGIAVPCRAVQLTGLAAEVIEIRT